MAATFTRIRSTSRTPLLFVRSRIKPCASAPPPPPSSPCRTSVPAGLASPATHFSGSGSPTRRFTSFSRCSSELGCCWSMFPLHDAVAAARLTSCLSSASRGCRALSQDGTDGT